MRGYTWRKCRVWENAHPSCPTEGVKKDFRGAAIFGHDSGTDHTATRASLQDLKLLGWKPTTVKFVLFWSLPWKTATNQTKLAKLQPNRIFQSDDWATPFWRRQFFSEKKHSRVVSRTSTQHVSVIWKAVITLQGKLWTKVRCIGPHFPLGGEKSRPLKKNSVKNINFRVTVIRVLIVLYQFSVFLHKISWMDN